MKKILSLICFAALLFPFAGTGQKGIPVTPAAGDTALQSRLFVLSVGVSNYKYLRHLHYADKDARDIASIFEMQKGKLYKDVKTTLLVDSQATAGNVYINISRISREVKAGDIVVIFFSGHVYSESGDDETHLIMVDGQEGENVYMGGSVSYYNLLRKMATLPCKSVLFLEGGYKINSTPGNNTAILTSARPGQSSLEFDKYRNGLFAQALTEGLYGMADKDSTGFVNLRSLFYYIDERITKLSMSIGSSKQRPGFYCSDYMDTFNISKTIGRKLPELESTEATIISGQK